MGGQRPESLAPWISLGATLPPRGFWRGLEAVLLVTVMAGGGGVAHSCWYVMDREWGT